MMALAVLSILIYGTTIGFIIAKWKSGVNVQMTRSLGLAAVICHSVYLSQTLAVNGGINVGLFSASNVIALWLSLMALAFSFIQASLTKFIAPIFALSLLNIVFKIAFGTSETVVEAKTASHIIPSLLAYSVLTLTAMHAIMLWIQNNALKTQQLNRLIDVLPPLDVLEKVLFWMIAVGFALLSLSIVSGMLFIDNFWSQKLGHKTLFTSLSWIIFGALLFGRMVLHWRGTQVIKWTFGGYACLVLGFFGSKLVIEYIL